MSVNILSCARGLTHETRFPNGNFDISSTTVIVNSKILCLVRIGLNVDETIPCSELDQVAYLLPREVSKYSPNYHNLEKNHFANTNKSKQIFGKNPKMVLIKILVSD